MKVITFFTFKQPSNLYLPKFFTGGNATVTGEHIPGCSNKSPCPIAADGTTHDHIIDFYPSRNISQLGVRTKLSFENGTTTDGNVSVLNSKIVYGQSYTLFFQGTASGGFRGKRANNTFIVYDVSTGRIEFCYERRVIFV